jgi:hypothetical protein
MAALIGDAVPVVLPAVGILIGLLATRDRRTLSLFALVAGATAVALVLLTRIEINHAPEETMRFLQGVLVWVPTVAIVWCLAGRKGELAWWTTSMGVL